MNRRVRVILSICSIIIFAGLAFIGYLIQNKYLIYTGVIFGFLSLVYGAFAVRGPKEYHVEKSKARNRRKVEDVLDEDEDMPEARRGRRRERSESVELEDPPITRESRVKTARPRKSFNEDTTPILVDSKPVVDEDIIKVTTMVAGIQKERNRFNLQQVIKQLIADKYYKNYGRGMRDREMEEDYEVGKIEEGVYRWAMDGRRLPYVKIQVESGKKLVKVLASYDKEYYKQIGQIPSAKAGQIIKMMESAKKYKTSAIIKGGQYKYIEDHFSADSNGDTLKVISNTVPYEVALTITFKM